MNPNALIEAIKEEMNTRAMRDWEIYYADSESFKAGVYEAQVDQYAVSNTAGLSLRVLIDGRMGYATTQSMAPDQAAGLVQSACDNAAVTDAQEALAIWPGSDSYPEADQVCKSLSTIGGREKIDLAMAMEGAALAADPRVLRVQTCQVSTGQGRVRIVNGYGLDLDHAQNYLFAVLSLIVADADKKNNGADFYAGQDFAAVDPQKLAKEAAKEAIDFLHAKSIPSGEYPVALRWDAACSLLETFWSVFSADAAQKGLSRLAGREGESIANPAVTIIDDPLLPNALAGGPFDDEGVACFTKKIVENGKLMTFLHNLKTAKKAGIASTGNAAKSSPAAPVGISPTNCYIAPGEWSDEDMLQKLGDGVLITQLAGLHSGANAVTGDFSLSAKGYRVEGGQITFAIEQITLAGNFYQMLRDIHTVGSDVRFDGPSDGCFGSPMLLVDGLKISGE